MPLARLPPSASSPQVQTLTHKKPERDTQKTDTAGPVRHICGLRWEKRGLDWDLDYNWGEGLNYDDEPLNYNWKEGLSYNWGQQLGYKRWGQWHLDYSDPLNCSLEEGGKEEEEV